MKQAARFLLFFAFLLYADFANARGWNPRNKGNGDGDGTGSCDASIKLPVGFPFGSSDAATSSNSSEASPAKSNIVYSFDLSDEIGPTALHQTRNALAEARDLNADYVLIHISSSSGTLDAAQDIRNELQHFNKPVLVYVDEHAIPASKLISSAGDSVYLFNGTSAINTKARTPKPICVSIAAQRKAEKFNSVTLTSWNSDKRNSVSKISRTPMSFFSLNEGSTGMTEVLNHAGLNEMKVVEYKETFLSQVVDLLLKPATGFVIILLFSFFISLQRRSSLPGPVSFMLLLFTPVLVYPLLTGGLATQTELCLLGIISLFSISYRGERKIFVLLSISGLIISIFYCRSGVLGDLMTTRNAISLLGTASAVLCGWYLHLFFHTLQSIRSYFRFSLRFSKA